MAPIKFLPGDLVLVNFPGYGYWPAQITQILKDCQRKVKCFGKGENGYAQPKDMIYFNEEIKLTHLSDNSWIDDSTRKEALKQIETKYSKLSLKKSTGDVHFSTQVSKKTKKHDLQNNNEKNGRDSKASGSSEKVHFPIKDSTGKKKMSEKSTKQSVRNNNVRRNEKDAEKDKDPDTNVNVEGLQSVKVATNEKQNMTTQESKQLKNLEGKKRNRLEETVERIKLEKELERVKSEHKEEMKVIRDDHDEEIKDIRVEHKAEMKVIRDDHDEEIKDIRVEHEEEIRDIRLKIQTDYEKKLQKSSDDYEERIKDLEMRLEEELSAASSANQKADNFKTDLENMSAKVASLEDEVNYEKKLQKSSTDYEERIKDLEMRLEEEITAANSANQKADNFKTDLENMSAKVASLEETKASLEDEVKTLTHALEDSFAIHISSQLRQLQKEEGLVEKEGPIEQVINENTVESEGKTRKRVEEEEDGSDSREEKRMRVELEEDKSIVNEEGLVGEEKNDNRSRCRIM